MLFVRSVFVALSTGTHAGFVVGSSESLSFQTRFLLLRHVVTDSACRCLRPRPGCVRCRAHTISVKSQGAGPHMELGDWARYFAQPPAERRKLYNIVSLSLANTPLEVLRTTM